MTKQELNKGISKLVVEFLTVNHPEDEDDKHLQDKQFLVLMDCGNVLGTQFFRLVFNLIHFMAKNSSEMEEVIDEYVETITGMFKTYCRDRMAQEIYSQEKENE